MSPTLRALRVGVVLGDKLVEERLFRSDVATSITIGQSLRATLSVPADGVPASQVLFVVEHGKFTLNGTPLEPSARGKIRIGDATVLYQELSAPPIVPRPQLPASIRGTFADRIDRRLAVIVAGSLVVHLGIASWAWLSERDVDARTDSDVAQYDPPTYEVTDVIAPEVPVAPTTGEPGVAAPARPSVQTPRAPGTIADPTRLPDPVDADRWANVITGNVPGMNGQAELPNRISDSALDNQIRHIRDADQNIVGRPTTRDPGMHIGTGPEGPRIGDPTLDQTTKREGVPPPRLTPLPMPKPPGKGPSLTMNQVLARIQNAYMPGLQRCYVKQGLAHDPTLSAKVTISFTVDETGSATDNVAHGATAEVDSCISAQMAGWKFSVPKDEGGDPTDVAFKLQLALQPS